MHKKMPTKKPFSDVPHDNLYETHIDNLYAFDIFKTQPDNRFHPEGIMTQGEFADLLLRAHGWFGFPDDIEKNKAKMVSGIPNFNRNTVITRQTAAVMIQNLKQIQPAPKVKITGKTDKWATEAIQALVSQGIVDPDIKPKSDGSIDFRSKQPLLRQEASALLDKAFGYYTLPLKIK
ncbi:S-layer homology domain-containing protein [Peribacillus frigoritolerans]|nr:S-layer homology domain-containing protein [Peribacillus frigoritolerans]